MIHELQDRLSPEVADSFGAAMKQLAALGATVDEVSIPSIDGAVTVALNIIWSEALEYHESMLKMHADDYGRGVRRMLEMGMTMPVTSYIRAQRARPRILGEAMRALEKFDEFGDTASQDKRGAWSCVGGLARGGYRVHGSIQRHGTAGARGSDGNHVGECAAFDANNRKAV